MNQFASAASITPGANTSATPGAVPPADTTHQLLNPAIAGSIAASTAFRRANRPGYRDWLHHIGSAAGCTRPIRLAGDLLTVDKSTGQLLAAASTAGMPDGIIYKACGNRRASVCPACSAVYQNDAYQLLHAGLAGGKSVPETVGGHPAVFATFTAPSFGPVHARVIRKHVCRDRKHCDCRPEPCRARRADDPASMPCPHGKHAVCFIRHDADDPLIGQPLCLDCYDHETHVVWNLFAGQLWRRTKQNIDRYLARLVKARGLSIRVEMPDGSWRWISPVRVSHGKAAEFQARGAVHFHALIRLDGVDPDNPDAILPPPEAITGADLDEAVRHAANHTGFDTPAHPADGSMWTIEWGRQLDVHPINLAGRGEVSDKAVAGYLAKYTTKSTEAAGHSSTRITRDNLHLFTAVDTHVARLINACWALSRNPTPLVDDVDANPYLRLERWAHMLGFGGHFLTKTPRYSTTFAKLRAARVAFRRDLENPSPHALIGRHDQGGDADETILVVGNLNYVGTGWRTLGDALLANTAAAQAREYTRAGREEIAHLTATNAPSGAVA